MSIGRNVAASTARIRQIFEQRPSAARNTKSATASLSGDSWRTLVQAGQHRLVIDQPAPLGGYDSGPNPGDLLRASLAACLAQNYAMNAEQCGVELEHIEVTVESDIDLRTAFGASSDAPAGFIALRYTTRLFTESPPEYVRELQRVVEATSPSLDDLRRAVEVRGSVEVLRPGHIEQPV